VSSSVFWRALGVQAVAVALLFAVLLLLPLDGDFFDDYGFAIGPVAWTACALVTARALSLPTAIVLLAALAGGVAGAIVLLVASHWAGMVAALLVFAASCGGATAEPADGAAAGS